MRGPEIQCNAGKGPPGELPYNSGMSPRSRLIVALTSTALTGYILLGSLLGRVLGDSTYGQLALFNEVVHLVLDAYVEPVNVDRALAGARLGLTEALDGDSYYLDQAEFQAYQQPAEGERRGRGPAADPPPGLPDGRGAATGLAGREGGHPARGHREDDRHAAHAPPGARSPASACCAARPDPWSS